MAYKGYRVVVKTSLPHARSEQWKARTIWMERSMAEPVLSSFRRQGDGEYALQSRRGVITERSAL